MALEILELILMILWHSYFRFRVTQLLLSGNIPFSGVVNLLCDITKPFIDEYLPEYYVPQRFCFGWI